MARRGLPRAARTRTAPPVLIDTHIWVEFEAGRSGAVRARLSRPVDLGRAAFIRPVWLEFARGLRQTGAEFDHAAAGYRRTARFVPLAAADWDGAVRLARATPRGKHPIQPADLLLAAVSLRTGAPIWSTDPDLARLAATDRRVKLFLGG